MKQRCRPFWALALVFFLVGIHALLAAPSSAGPGVFYVATNGNDAWSGSRPSPNWRRSDGPVATLPRALSLAREWRQQHGSAGAQPVSIALRRGVYFLTEPLVLKPEDSNLTVAAFEQEPVVISGGRLITGWHEANLGGKAVWAAELPGVKEGRWRFHELWVNEARAVCARHPNQGYLAVEKVPDKPGDWTQGQTRFQFREGDLKPTKSPTDAEVVVMSRWVESRLPVSGWDEKERLVRFSKKSVFSLEAGDLYYREGALEDLDQPGEWCLETASGTLYYLPRPGEKLGQVHAIAPVLAQVVRFEGQPDAGRFVERISLRGLTFSHTEWYFPTGFDQGTDRPEVSPAPKAEVGGFAQAAVGVPGALWGEGVRDSALVDCRVLHLGNYGLELTRGCQSNHVRGCVFSDLGAGGMKIGETAIRTQPADLTRANEIANCRIIDGGKLFHSAIGVWIGQSPDNRLTHNLIQDFYYTGISIGWTWGYGPALATNNTVEFNHVHHIGAKSNGDGPILSDMGGIYTLGKQPGTTIRNNLWHDIAATRYGGWGIYFDEGSSGIVAENNLVYRTTHGGFHQHYGETNIVRNNIFAFARDHQIQRSRNEPHLSFSFETNIVYFDSGVLLGSEWSNNQYRMNHNLYFDARPDAKPDALRLGPDTWAKWQQRGHDQASLVADPLFYAPHTGDFRLSPNSPAFKLGFRALELQSVGPVEK